MQKNYHLVVKPSALVIEKNAQAGKAKIQIEVSLEELPFLSEEVKDLFNTYR